MDSAQHLPGYGWVVDELGDVRKRMHARGLRPEDPVPEDLMAYYWGGADPYRVKLGIGRDLTLNPPQKGLPVIYLMYPFAEVGEVTLGWLDPEGFACTLTYRSPGRKRTARWLPRGMQRAPPPCGGVATARGTGGVS